LLNGYLGLPKGEASAIDSSDVTNTTSIIAHRPPGADRDPRLVTFPRDGVGMADFNRAAVRHPDEI
jgi:hypothetical protein